MVLEGQNLLLVLLALLVLPVLLRLDQSHLLLELLHQLLLVLGQRLGQMLGQRLCLPLGLGRMLLLLLDCFQSQLLQEILVHLLVQMLHLVLPVLPGQNHPVLLERQGLQISYLLVQQIQPVLQLVLLQAQTGLQRKRH